MEPSLEIIASLCFEKLKSLPKTGKPLDNEWTVLAGIVEHNRQTATSKVVSLGCGTKCIGQDKQCPKGYILNDSHAETIARRAFLRYLYHELNKDADSIFEWDHELVCYKLKQHYEYHFLCTQTPCGDACIEMKLETDDDEVKAKRLRISNNEEVIYTGAKRVNKSGPLSDEMEQTPGELRTKPGRGKRTLSMSCSDKLARWNVLGVQGALIDSLIHEPIYFTSLNFCSSVASVANIERAIFKRWQHKEFRRHFYKPQKPLIRISPKFQFDYAQQPKRQQPSPNGLSWSHLPDRLRPYEISVNGKRQGVTKKKVDTPVAALAISKYKLFVCFLELLGSQKEIRKRFDVLIEDLPKLTYATCKQLAKKYQEAWQQLKYEYFEQWTRKPSKLLEFKWIVQQTNCLRS
ncbi:tRNA-specific adenosine deaminase 1 [Drosophila tropicalis]|uniref:tRNA-specific adenosine deaminase 1 n=1 Tax=Drosophila tropicalis TaxID=46794 RepID=UPI0035ABF3D0